VARRDVPRNFSGRGPLQSSVMDYEGGVYRLPDYFRVLHLDAREWRLAQVAALRDRHYFNRNPGAEGRDLILRIPAWRAPLDAAKTASRMEVVPVGRGLVSSVLSVRPLVPLDAGPDRVGPEIYL